MVAHRPHASALIRDMVWALVLVHKYVEEICSSYGYNLLYTKQEAIPDQFWKIDMPDIMMRLMILTHMANKFESNS